MEALTWIALLAFIAVATLLLGVRKLVAPGRDPILERMARATGAALASPPAPSSTVKRPSRLARAVRPLARLAGKLDEKDVSQLRRSLAHAAYRGEHAVEVFFGAKVALAFLLGGGVALVAALRPAWIGPAWELAVVAAAIGFYAPNLLLRQLGARRQLAITRALPDAIDLLVTCVEAGLGVEAALQRVSRELALAAPILAQELALTTMEIQAGVQRAAAFRRLADRTGLDELRVLSATLIQTEMFGTSIAAALRVHANTMRIRRTHRAEERAGVVAVKMMLPLILCILPSLFVVLLGPAIMRIARVLMPVLGGTQ